MKRLTISPIMEALLKIPLDLENSRVERSRRSRGNFVGRDTKLSLAPKVRIGGKCDAEQFYGVWT